MVDLDDEDYKDWYEESNFEFIMEQQAEIEWLRKNPHNEILASSITKLDSILALKLTEDSDFFVKMQLSYAVTVMESCLQEMLKSLVMTSDVYVENALSNIKELKSQTFSLSEAFKIDVRKKLRNYVLEHLSSLLYHKIDKVVKVYQAVLDINEVSKVDISVVSRVTALRHDIVHRDGKTMDGSEIYLVFDDLYCYVDYIKFFISTMHSFISDSVEIQEAIQLAEFKKVFGS